MKDLFVIHQLKKKDQNIFNNIFESYKNLVFYEANNILRNKEDAEDVTQEVFIEFFNYVDELTSKTNIKLHLVSLSRRRAIDLYRKKKNKEVLLEDDIELFTSANFYVDPLLGLNGVLTDLEAKIISLRVVFNFSFIEISKDLKETIGFIQSTYYKAMKKLKKHYKEGK